MRRPLARWDTSPGNRPHSIFQSAPVSRPDRGIGAKVSDYPKACPTLPGLEWLDWRVEKILVTHSNLHVMEDCLGLVTKNALFG